MKRDDITLLGAHERYNVPALQRGLQMLSLFSRERKELTGADFVHLLELPRASIFRILQTLESAGFIERIEETSRYRLGVAVLRLGFEYIASMEITEHGRPILDGLRDSTGYSAHLVVRDARDVVIIAKSAGFAKLFSSMQVGARLPAHATVLGRVLLSSLSQQSLEQLYQGDSFKRYTDQTPTNFAALKSLIETIKTDGYGVSQGGFESSLSTIAAPVKSISGQVQAAMSITVPATSIAPAELSCLVEKVVEAANHLSDRLNGSHPPRNT